MKQVAYFLIWILSLVAVPAFATVGVGAAVYAVLEYKADYGWVNVPPASSDKYNPCRGDLNAMTTEVLIECHKKQTADAAAYDAQLRALPFFDRYLKPLNFWLVLGALVSFGFAAASVGVVRWSWKGLR